MSDRDHISGGRGVDESRQFSSFSFFLAVTNTWIIRPRQFSSFSFFLAATNTWIIRTVYALLVEQYGPSRTLGQNSCFMQIQNTKYFTVRLSYFSWTYFSIALEAALRAINFLGSRRQRMCTPGMRVAARVVLNMLSVRATFRMNIYFDQAVAYIEKSAYLTEVTSGLKCAISLKI